MIRVTRVRRVPNTNDSVRTSFVAGQRLDEAQQQPRVALHRARDVAQHDELARLADLAPPDPLGELAGREVLAEHGPLGDAPAVRVELVPPGAPALEARTEQVHEPLGVAQLGGGHAVEVPMAQHLAHRVGVGRDRHALDLDVVVRVARDLDAHRRQLRHGRLAALARLVGGARLALLVALGVGREALHAVRRQPAAATAPELGEHPVVDLAVVAPAHEQRRTGVADDPLVADVDEAQGAGEVDGRRHVDRQPGGPQRAPEPDRLGEQPAPVDQLARRGLQDRRLDHAHSLADDREHPSISRRGCGLISGQSPTRRGSRQRSRRREAHEPRTPVRRSRRWLSRGSSARARHRPPCRGRGSCPP